MHACPDLGLFRIVSQCSSTLHRETLFTKDSKTNREQNQSAVLGCDFWREGGGIASGRDSKIGKPSLMRALAGAAAVMIPMQGSVASRRKLCWLSGVACSGLNDLLAFALGR